MHASTHSGHARFAPPSKLAVAGWVALCLAAGGIGSFATNPKIPTWYATLAKPAWNPPSWVFGPVWTTLYILMGVAAYLVWRHREHVNRNLALTLFGVQLALNTAWSFLFFAMENPGAAFGEILVLWVAIVATMVAFARISRTAAGLLAPYIAWVTFAAFLNFTIWQLNL